jgi:hypothetical protein
MRNLIWRFAVVFLGVLAALTAFGATRYMNSDGDGIPVYPQEVGATPAAPYTCSVTHRGKMIYVDDSNDTAEAYLCFCGVDADDSSYVWLKAEAPATDCF